jgi:hypothetical protein
VVVVLRAMKVDEDGFPKPGWSGARTLVARCSIDIPLGQDDGFVAPRMGGVSVSPPPPENLPPSRLPRDAYSHLGGKGKDPIWELETDNLPRELTYRPDPDSPDTHGFIEPTWVMSFADYLSAAHDTRSQWTLM